MARIEQGALERFVHDMLARSLSCNDWLCDANFSDLSDVSQNIFDPPARDAMGMIFKRCVEVIDKTTQIQTDGTLNSLDVIDFHSHIGWILKYQDHKAYLGKITLLESTRLIIGVRSYFSGHGTVRGGDQVRIGAFCSIAEGLFANCFRDFHPMTHASTYNFSENRRLKEDGINIDLHYQEFEDTHNGIEIGNDVWIGRNVRIYHGSKIGDGCVIAEGSLVRGELEPYGIYAGQPARLIRYRFSKNICRQLKEIAWWNWSMQKIVENKTFFNSPFDDPNINISSLIDQK